jgi:hypothetical protein
MGEPSKHRAEIIAESEALPVLATPIEQMDQGESALAFYTLRGLSGAMTAASYCVEAEVIALVRIIQEAVDPWAKMAAIKMIRQHIKEALLMTGGMVQQTARQVGTGRDGTQLTAEVTRYQLQGIGSQTERLLQEALHTTKVIVLENQKESNDEQVQGTEVEPTQSDSGGQPTRDLGGGGLCASSRDSARSAQDHAWASRGEVSPAGGSTDPEPGGGGVGELYDPDGEDIEADPGLS